MAHVWDPDRYLIYADERGRPFVDLLNRVDADPAVVVDLGCGPGNLTRLLAERWPGAQVHGVDDSVDMIDRARADVHEVSFQAADLRDWAVEPDRADRVVDVLFSNAALQWVPGHLALLPDLLAAVRPGGVLAFQVPGNFDQPSHRLLAELASEPPYDAHAAGVARPAAHDAATYLRALSALGCAVDAWETTYVHVLRGPDPVFTWISGTGARPTLQALPDDRRRDFEDEYKARLAVAYPTESDGTVLLPFRRVFVVARIEGE